MPNRRLAGFTLSVGIAALLLAVSATYVVSTAAAADSTSSTWADDLTPIAAADWSNDRAAHLLERAGFAGTPEDIAGLAGMTPRQAVDSLGQQVEAPELGPVVVLVMDRERIADYQRLASRLREAGIRAEIYLGAAGMKAQMRYADRRAAPCVVIQGSDERAKGEVQIKDLIQGAKEAAAIASNQEWRAMRPAQFAAREDELVEAVRRVLDAHDAARHSPTP